MKAIYTPNAPAAIGPYSQAIVHDNLMFCSGQIPLNPETMEIQGTNIEEQTLQVMINIENLLAEQKIGLDKIIKTTIFLDNMNDFAAMNQIYEKALNRHKPARSTVEVSRLPKDVLIEIECIAGLK